MDFIKTAKRRIKKLLKKISRSKGTDSKKTVVKTENKKIQVEDKTARLDEAKSELNAAVERYQDMDRDKVWAFIAGQASEDFRGNPKYLFVYINRYRPDIAAYWLCSSDETIEQVRNLGFVAHRLDTPAAQYAINRTGVLVVEQVKFSIPEGFENVKYLNLWHGVGGFKRVERKQFLGDISMDLARKYVACGTFYRDHQLIGVTSPETEKEFARDCGVDSNKFVRAGYLRCLYQQNFEPIVSFEHDLRKVKGLPADTKMVVFAPTFRAKLGGTFSKVVTDIEALYQCCERNNLLLIFKVHPNMEKEEGFLRAWEAYGDRQRFWFWNNRDDFYEIMDQMDMAIIDYSSIFADLVAAGVKHYIRYIFDYDDYKQDGFNSGDYFERTAGKVCYTFDELLDAIDTYQERDDSGEFQRINDKLWSYAGGGSDFDKVIQQVLDFKVETREFPILYSFDVFDTLISRKVLDPMGIFYGVRERMAANGGFPLTLVQRYPAIRHAAELNVREYYSKTKVLRHSERVEITFTEIFERMADVYNLTGEQIRLLEEWELELELDNVIPLDDQIDLVKELLSRGEKIVLISDMYLPREFILKLLAKADPILAELPLFLSSDYGVLKTSQQLYFEVYKSFEPFYDFKKWVHYGDNVNADQTQARRFKICARKVDCPAFNDIQNDMVKYLNTYDGYQVAAVQARMYQNALYQKDEFVASYVVLIMVPYVDWVIRDAERRGYKTLYFISRDGHPLKRIADAIIRARGLDIRTKYIYASRRVWRVPSFITEVDEGFWESYGSFADLISKDKLFQAMNLDEETFRRFFPSIDPDAIDFENKEEVDGLIDIFKDSKEYNNYLLETAAKERVLVEGYLRQEIDFDEKFAVVEYYGRGYTQDSMVNLCQDIVGEEIDVPFYYSRSVLPTIGNAVRHNFTTNATQQFFVECIFANMPYKSIESYEVKNGRIEPVIVPLQCDTNLFDAMERILPAFAEQYASLELAHPEDTDRALYDFALDYYNDNRTNKTFAENISTLIDSVALYGKKREFAPPYTMENLEQFANKTYSRGSGVITTSIAMSVMRSSAEVREKYDEMYQILPGDDVTGGRLLSEEEMKENRKFRQKYEDLQEKADQYRDMYEAAVSENKVRNKVLFITNGKSLDNTSLEIVREKIMERDNVEVSTICMDNTQKTASVIVSEAATAKFIVTPHPIIAFCKITFRPETKEIMLNSAAFPLYNQKLAANRFLKWQQKYIRLSSTNDIAVLQVPSKHLEERFRRNYSRNTRTDCTLYGCCNTDIYFDQTAQADAREELIACFPEARDKKVILYMPTVRTRKSCPDWLSMPDMEVLQKLIGDEYVVVVNFSTTQFKGKYGNVIEVPGFSKMINKDIPIRKLMIAADILIGNYRDAFFESALMEKPVYFTASDYEEVIKSNNMDAANEFESYVFGPIVATAHDLADQLKQADHYDYSRMRRFREEMLAGCDGNSVSRVVEYLSNSL